MRLILATHNPGKIKELKEALAPYFTDIISAAELGLTEPEETGKTLEENALIKACAIANEFDAAVLADDSGLGIINLPSWNPVYTKDYATKHGDYDTSTQIILNDLAGKPADVYYECCIVFLQPNTEPLVCRGRVDGTLVYPAHVARGSSFGYDPYFLLPDRNCTVSELEVGEKNAISHRGQAMKELINLLQSKAA